MCVDNLVCRGGVMESIGYRRCKEIAQELPDGIIKERNLRKIIWKIAGVDERTIQKYLQMLVMLGFVRKVSLYEYERK